MHPASHARTRRSIAAAAVVAAHLLLLLLPPPGGQDARSAGDETTAPSLLVWLDDTPVAAPAPDHGAAIEHAAPANKTTRRQRPQAGSVAAAPAPPSPGVTRDWYGAAEGLARAPDGAAKPRPFGQMPPPPLRPCAAPSKPFEWSPEPRRAGLAGGLPYVRMGRCVVGLGFFGCRLGEAPQPNGRLLEGMKEAPAVPGSVPDDRDCSR